MREPPRHPGFDVVLPVCALRRVAACMGLWCGAVRAMACAARTDGRPNSLSCIALAVLAFAEWGRPPNL